MKKCGYCGRANEDAAATCTECGGTNFESDAPVAPPPVEAPQPSPEPVIARILTDEEKRQSHVTLCRCRTLEEADLIVAQLAADGIAATIPDENLMQAVAWNTNTYGYVRVQVSPTQYDEAVEILKTPAKLPETAPNPLDIEDAKAREARRVAPLDLSMKCLMFLLPGTFCAGLLVAGMIRTNYVNKGYQRRADEVWRYFAIRFVVWFIIFLAITLARA